MASLEVKLFIDGEFCSSSDGKTFKSTNPANGEEVAICHLPSEKDLESAITAAVKALRSGEWKEADKAKRKEYLLSISEKLLEQKEHLVELEIKDSGSTRRKAEADIYNAASFFKVMAKTLDGFEFRQKDENATRAGFSKNFREYEPVGVCAQIIPWNFPLVMAAWKIAPVIASGCTTILKTAEETPVTASVLAEIIKQSGVPKGVVNIVTGGAAEGKYLVNSPKVNKVAFTGSTQVGKQIYEACSKDLKRVTLELGGKSANIILDDADLDIAVDGSLYAFLYHSGQACDSGTRLLIHEKIYNTFMEKFLKRIAEIKVGDPSLMETGMGPLVSEKQLNTVMSYINKTKSQKANLIYGGNQLEDGIFSKGFYVEPTAFDISTDNTIFHEEIFGPVVGITRVRSDEEAISLANHSKYGLAAAVWGKDYQRAKNVAKRIEAGTVWINEYHLLNPGMPFGGFKQSGIGREMGREGLLAYLEVRHLFVSDCPQRSKRKWYDLLF